MLAHAIPPEVLVLEQFDLPWRHAYDGLLNLALILGD
jgi:hypothetical protein